MRSFVRNIILFTVVVFILDKCFYPLRSMRPYLEDDQRLNEVLLGRVEAEVLIIGSSRGHSDIDASVLSEQLGRRVYNLSYGGTEVEFHAFLLKQYLAHNPAPELIIKVIDDDFELTVHDYNVFRTDLLQPVIYHPAVREELVARGKKSWILSQISVVHQLGKLGFKPARRKSISTVDKQFGIGIDTVENEWSPDWKYDFNRQPYDLSTEDSVKLAALKVFEDLALSASSDLVYVVPPSYWETHPTFINRIRNVIAPSTSLIVYDRNNEVYRNENYFSDRFHLNAVGARIYSLEISGNLKDRMVD